MASHREWLEISADIVIDELSGFELIASRDHVRAMIEDRLAAVSTQLGISEEAARLYLDEEGLRAFAQNTAITLVDEQPGADLHLAPRTVSISFSDLTRTMVALAEATHLREVLGDSVGVHGTTQLLSLFAQVLHELSEWPEGPILVPPAGLVRAARLLDASAAMVRGRQLSSSEWAIPEGSESNLADAFLEDAAVLRAMLDALEE